MSDHDLKMQFLRTLQAPSAVKRKKQIGRVRSGGGDRESLELSVHPRHVQVARDLTKAFGLTGIGFRNDGTCIVSDEGHAREYARRTTPGG
jgi:hypothetical protein